MGIYLTWEIEDDEGLNPLEAPGLFEFHVECDIESGDPGYLYTDNGDGYPGHSPTVEIVGATCARIRLKNADSYRRPTEAESARLSDWFFVWLDTHQADIAQIHEQAFEYAHVEPDDEHREY